MTAVAGVVYAAANWNTYIRDNLNASGVGVLATGVGRYLAGTGVGGVAERAANLATVATSQTTTSTTYVNLTTTGPALAIATGTKAMIAICSAVSNNTAGQGGRVAVDISGATTSAASDTNSFLIESGNISDTFQGTWVTLVTGLTAGSNTFTLKYRVVGSGTCAFANRNIVVVPF
jgi:hypothetical protein